MSEISKIAEKLSGLTILQAAELVSTLEKKWGISTLSTASECDKANKTEKKIIDEKNSFSITLKSFADKIKVIKIIKEVTGVGLKEAKEKIENLPFLIKENLDKKSTEALKEKLLAAGAEIEIK